MARSPVKGERRGGRAKNTPNMRTVEQMAEVARAAQSTRAAGRKFGKEVLDDLMHTAVSLAAREQKKIMDAHAQETEPDAAVLERFWKAMEMAGVFARALAPFQSPTFKAIAVVVPPGGEGNGAPPPALIRQDGNVLTIDDPAALTRVYKAMLRGAKEK